MAFPPLIRLTILYLLFFCERSIAFWVPSPLYATSPGTAPPSQTTPTRMKMSSTQSIQEEQVELSDGIYMQVLSSVPTKGAADKALPPILFLHGSFHGAWCWAENYFSYFTSLGYPVAALSWRGTEKTFAGEGVKKVKISEHVEDLNAILEEYMPRKFNSAVKPVLVSHSFGGLSIMKYLEDFPERCKRMSGAVIACSVPPSGNGKMTMRFLRRSLRDSWKVTKGLAMKKVINDGPLCRELFFGGLEDDHDVTDADVARYQDRFERDTVATIDLLDLAKKLPSAATDDNGKALFLSSEHGSSMPPFLVIGATEDFIVDRDGVDETATYFGLVCPVMVESPHDIMLGRKSQNAANEIHDWIQNVVLKQAM